MSRCVMCVWLAVLALAPATGSAETPLPEGSAPAPVVNGYFPDRVHEFVWRNWGAVEAEKLAKVIGATAADVTGVATSMGLPADPVVPPQMLQRGYATLIRRNWHLLPYDQLMELVEMTPERLAFTLREEDFLWVKLGRLKPKCEPIVFQPPDEAARKRAEEIRGVVEEVFGDELSQPAEPRFDFVRKLNEPLQSAVVPAADDQIRIVYSYVAVYGDPLLNPGLNPYPDGLLQRLAGAGINGVWLQAVLRDLAPGGEAFPEFGEGSEQRLGNLRELVERAGKFGVKIYLYLNEPRAMPNDFFANRPEMAGVNENDLTALCTTQPVVRTWMSDARAPKPVYLMSVSEWSLPIERGGVKSVVGEYSISSVGPGPRALHEWQFARDAGLKTGTEIQFNNTCEIASIPYLPVMDLIGEHCSKLRAAAQLDAMLIGWTMGGYPSPNFQLAAKFSRTPAPNLDAALDELALERFGPEGAPHARRAWTLLSDGFRQYPFHISVVYTSPIQIGPANPLYLEPTGYSATMWGIPYDDLDGWRGPYPPEVFAAQFEKVAEGWANGISELEAAVEKCPAPLRPDGEADLRLARAAAIHFQSVANQARFVTARDALDTPAMKRCLESEVQLARQLYTLTRHDSRIGFEPSCQYFYLPQDLVEKAINCRWLEGRLAQ